MMIRKMTLILINQRKLVAFVANPNDSPNLTPHIHVMRIL